MDRRPYIEKPPWAKHVQRILYVARYMLTGVAGLMTIVALGHEPIAREGGWVLIAGSLIAIGGVVTRRYHFELIALWPVIGGLGALILWLVLNDAQVVGWLVGALIPDLAARLLALNLIANDARRTHEATGVDDESD